jgi:hypothetical protein
VRAFDHRRFNMAEKATGKTELSEQSIADARTTLSNVTALARFEFEPGKQNEGTKILMVEWQDEDRNRSPGSWEVTWPGKKTVLGAENKTDKVDNAHRLYFLLPPYATVPPQITLSWNSKTGASTQSLTVLALPAIFAPELGATARERGKKGILHTIWAKSRLQVLEREIEEEQALNLEGVALEMAISERDWILSTFGLAPKPPTLDISSLPEETPNGQLSPSLQSPRTPGGRRLSEKLRGLTLGTSEKDLAKSVNTPTREFHPLSPEGSDIAYSSFNAFRNGPTSSRANAGGKMMTAANPPEYIRRKQQDDSFSPFGYMQSQNRNDAEDESLFAIALSPRTPDVAKSPFSFQSEDIAPYTKLKGEKSS